MTSLTKTLYIAIEIFDRELGGALLLASEAVSKGWTVILGGKQAVFNNLPRFRQMPGIFFLKSIVPGEVPVQNKLLSYGHRITSLDVEGLVPSQGEAGVRLRYSEESIALTDVLFFWGDNHYHSVQSVYSSIKDKSVVSGSPIIDEIKLRRYLVSDKQRSRDTILIGTSCGYANHMNGIEFAKKMAEQAYAKNLNGTDKSELEKEIELDLAIFNYWQAIIPKISEHYKNRSLVLRPHPSENKLFWTKFAMNLPNVTVRQGGSIIDELLTAGVYLHFNSTSSIVSELLNVPSVMIYPPLDDRLLSRVTYVKNLSVLAETAEALISVIRNIDEMRKARDIKNLLSGNIANFSNGSSAAAIIIDSLEKRYCLKAGSCRLTRKPMNESYILFSRKMSFLSQVVANKICRLLLKRELPFFQPSTALQYARLKQPRQSMNDLRNYMRSLNIDGKHEVRSIDTNLFLIA